MKKLLLYICVLSTSCFLQAQEQVVTNQSVSSNYEWTTDHMHVGVRWQPAGSDLNSIAYDASSPMIAQDSSYATFWVGWNSMEPKEENINYSTKNTSYFRTIEAAVNECVKKNIKVEFVIFGCPAWASISGKAGLEAPKPDMFNAFVTRLATYFKGRVGAYQLHHESNNQGMFKNGDINYLMSEMFIKGAKAVKAVYNTHPAEPVIISTSGLSPCRACGPLAGLGVDANGELLRGGPAINSYLDKLIANTELMEHIDAININMSDANDGYGHMDDTYVPSTWGMYDLIRSKLDKAGYDSKKVSCAESWIVWDAGSPAVDVTGDGIKNEQDAYKKAITLIGQCLERGLNMVNLPWKDNSSSWSMGLTKLRDYDGKIKLADPSIVTPAADGGADIVTEKINSVRVDNNGKPYIEKSTKNPFTIANYINPSDPNHLHYYIWRWYSQISAGADEVIRHAIAGEKNNDITVTGAGFGGETYRISSYNKSKDSFTVLIYSNKANGKKDIKVSIPSQIQTGKYYNNQHSKIDFRGQGFDNGELYTAKISTKNISNVDGADVNLKESQTSAQTVTNNTLVVKIPKAEKFTTIEFIKSPTKD